jgi:hypothetical protein
MRPFWNKYRLNGNKWGQHAPSYIYANRNRKDTTVFSKAGCSGNNNTMPIYVEHTVQRHSIYIPLSLRKCFDVVSLRLYIGRGPFSCSRLNWVLLPSSVSWDQRYKREVAPADCWNWGECGHKEYNWKGVHPWLVRWARRAVIETFSCLGCSGQPNIKYFFSSPYTISIYVPPIAQQPGRQSCRAVCLLMCVSGWDCVIGSPPSLSRSLAFCIAGTCLPILARSGGGGG